MTGRVSALAVVALALAVGGCGDGDHAAHKGLPASTALVSAETIVREKPHSPERTLLSWWRSLQYGDLRGYMSLLSEPLRNQRRRDGLSRAELPMVGPQLVRAFPHIMRVEMAGDRATVFVNIEYRTLVGADRYSSSRAPQAFSLLREKGEWRIADDLYVEAFARPQLRAEARVDAKAGVRSRSTASSGAPVAVTPVTAAPVTATPTGTQPVAGAPTSGATGR